MNDLTNETPATETKTVIRRGGAKLTVPAAGEPGPQMLADVLNAPIRKARAAKAAKKIAKAKPAKKTAKAPKAARKPRAIDEAIAARPKATSAKAQRAADAAAGILPTPPDFSKPTHKPYRKRLEALVALVEAGDLAGLEAVQMIPPRSSSPKALHRYRDAAMIALKARAAQ